MTVSTKGDLSVESQEELTKWIRKNTHMHYVVIEHGESGRRHMHALLIFKESRDPRKLKDNVWNRMVKPWHEDSLARVAVKIQVCPGNDWYDQYLKKEKDCELISNTWDRDAAVEFFPTKEVQESLMAKSKLKTQACPWLTEDVEAWSASTFENTPEGANEYLKHRMFVLRNLVPVRDLRKRAETALMYWEYRNGVFSLSERERWLLKQLQDGPSFDVPVRRGPESSAPPSI